MGSGNWHEILGKMERPSLVLVDSRMRVGNLRGFTNKWVVSRSLKTVEKLNFTRLLDFFSNLV